VKVFNNFNREKDLSPVQLVYIRERYKRNNLSTFGKLSVTFKLTIILYILSKIFLFLIFYFRSYSNKDSDEKFKNCLNSFVKSSEKSF
jgi:hypothetical protein